MKDAFGVGFEEICVEEVVLGLFVAAWGGFYVNLQLFIFEFERLIFGSIDKRDKIFKMGGLQKGVFDRLQRPPFNGFSMIHAYIITSFNLHRD